MKITDTQCLTCENSQICKFAKEAANLNKTVRTSLADIYNETSTEPFSITISCKHRKTPLTVTYTTSASTSPEECFINMDTDGDDISLWKNYIKNMSGKPINNKNREEKAIKL